MKKILVIDDDAMVRLTLSRLLYRAGYDVVTAADGERGLTMLRAEQPSVVITDMMMPERDGVETIIKIKQEWPQIKIVAISGGARHGNRDILLTARNMGADDAIAKPFDADELLRSVLDMLGAPA